MYYPPIDPMSNPWAYSNATPPLPGREPWMMPGIYSPGQVAFNSNPGMSQLISMLAPGVLSSFSGPNTFIPHMTPTMSVADQIRMSSFQKQRYQTMYDVSQDNTSAVSEMFLGLTKMGSDTAANDPLTREHASFAASIANDPAAKMIASQIFGADNVEAALHGSKGDISSLNAKMSQMGYYMTDPSGIGRMGADAMSAYSRGVYSHLYEPDIDVKREEEAARSTDTAKRSQAKKRLQKAADTEDQILDDTEIVERLIADANSAKKTAELYTKYVSGGKETDARKQAEALVKYDRAIKESGVLTADEMSISQAGSAAQKSAVNNARGFLAGQVGQLAEYLQQTGQIGSSIGTKSLQERVAAVAELDVSDATYSRMGKELAKKRLADTNNQSDEAIKYRALKTQSEREAFIRDNAAPFEQEVRDTKQQAEKAAKGGKGAPKLEDVEKLGGFQNLAVDVDAEKTAKSLEGYLDAVAAVRDIFGDNGNPNAPMPALIATLNSLTGTAGAQMSSQKIATQLRQMQTAAKETGVSQRELIDLSLQSQNQARALGLTDADAMRGVTGSLIARKVMTENGEFNTPSYGEYNAQQSQQLAMELQNRGRASTENKALVAMVAMYASDPDAYKGTALEAAVEAYRTGSPTYVDPETGKTVDFAEEVATKGQLAIQELGYRAAETGVNKGRSAEQVERARGAFARQYSTAFNETENLELSNDEFIAHGQSRVVENVAERSLAVTAKENFETFGTFDRLKIAEEDQMATSKAVADRVEARAREAEKLPSTGDPFKDVQQRADYMQTHIEEDIRQGLEDANVKPARAAAEAKRLANDRDAYGRGGGGKAGELFRQGRVAVTGQSGELRKNMRVVERDIVEKRADAAKKSEARALTDDKLAQGFETTPLQRISDYYRSLPEANENFTLSGLKEAVGPGREFNEILRSIDKDMAVAFEQSEKRAKAAYIDEDEINNAVAAAKKGDVAALRTLAQVPEATKLVSEDEASGRLLARLKDESQTSNKELRDLSAKYGNRVYASDDEVKANRDDIIKLVHGNQNYYNDKHAEVLAPEETTVSQMHAAANARRGEAVGMTDEEKKAILERETAIQRSLTGGAEKDTAAVVLQIEKLAEASMPKTMFGRPGKISDGQHQKLMKLVRDKDTTKEDIKKFATDIGLDEDTAAHDEFVTAVSGVSNSAKLGGFAGSYGITKEKITGESKLTDVASDRKLPPPPDKEAEKKAAAAAAEAKKLEDAGVIKKDPAKPQGEGGQHPHQKTAGQEEQVSVLKDILAAIRALGGEEVKPVADRASAASPLKESETATEREAEKQADAVAAAYIAEAANKTKQEAEKATKQLRDDMPKVAAAIERTPVKADGTVDEKTFAAELKKAGVNKLPESVRKSLFTNEQGATAKKEEVVATVNKLRESLPVLADVMQNTPATTGGLVDTETVGARYGKAAAVARADKKAERIAAQTQGGLAAPERPQIEVTTLWDLIRAPFAAPAAPPPAATADGIQAGDDPVKKLSAVGRAAPTGGAKDAYISPAPYPINELFVQHAQQEVLSRRGVSALPFEADPTVPAVAQTTRGSVSPTGGLNFAQQLPNPHTTASAYQLTQESRVVNPKAEPGPNDKQKMEIVGRLTLDGLQEVIVAAAGEVALQTGGAPIVPG